MTVAIQFDENAAIELIANGAFLRDIAKQIGIDKRRLSEKLRQHPEYKAAKECAVECQLDEAQEAVLSAQEIADIARAREMWRSATWRAEREFPERWGQRTQVTITRGADLSGTLQAAEERLIGSGSTAAIPAISGNASNTPE